MTKNAVSKSFAIYGWRDGSKRSRAEQATGIWADVTPSNASKTASYPNGNYGCQTVYFDTANPGVAYCQFNCQGVWKSTNYGASWQGPINIGNAEGIAFGDNAGGITYGGVSNVMHAGTFRGTNYGYRRSDDGGITWTRYTVAGMATQDVYPPTVNPYNPDHLLIAGHEQDFIAQSTNRGASWSSITLNAGMLTGNVGTAFLFFVDTGNSTTTAQTWLWMGQSNGGAQGTWRTTNGGVSWAKVETCEHPHGASQIYQPNTTGTLLIAGEYATAGGQGVLQSTDYGATFAHVGNSSPATCVWGTPTATYSQYGWAIGQPNTITPGYQTGNATGSTWSNGSLPSGMADGGVAQTAVAYDGINRIMLSAQWHGGLWRYIEP